MTGAWAQLLPLLLAAGFITAVVGLLAFLNTRKETKTKTGAEAYEVYGKWVTGVITQASQTQADQAATIIRGGVVRAGLIDLCQDLIAFARSKGASHEEVEPYHDRLDDLRSQ